MKQKPSELHEVHYIAPFQTFWHEPLTFQRLFKSASTSWHKLAHVIAQFMDTDCVLGSAQTLPLNAHEITGSQGINVLCTTEEVMPKSL